MKSKIYTLPSVIITVMILIAFLTGCEQTNLEPALGTAPGGGTLTAYKAYTLDSITGTGGVYGRVVFWKDNANRTLVQLSVYNTVTGTSYPSGLYGGISGSTGQSLLQLYSVDGEKGEFSTYKFFVIDNGSFYNNLDSYDAHINIFAGTTLIATGDIGKNAKPIEQK